MVISENDASLDLKRSGGSPGVVILIGKLSSDNYINSTSCSCNMLIEHPVTYK